MIKVGKRTVVAVRSVGGTLVWFPALWIAYYQHCIFWHAGEGRWWSTESSNWLEGRAERHLE